MISRGWVNSEAEYNVCIPLLKEVSEKIILLLFVVEGRKLDAFF